MSARKSAASQRLSQGTPRSQTTVPVTAELKELARAAVRYLLMNDFNKVPIKHSDIVKNVTKNVTKNTNQVMQVAAKMLKDIYGIDLIDDGQAPRKHYLLLNNLKHQDHISLPLSSQKEQALLAIILSLIFMKTNGRPTHMGVKQEEVHSMLRLVGIDETEMHPYFGDVKGILEVFKSQRYLDFYRIENTDPPKHEYRWGLRAVHEVSAREALAFASEMYGRENIETWSAHYKAVVESERGQ